MYATDIHHATQTLFEKLSDACPNAQKSPPKIDPYDAVPIDMHKVRPRDSTPLRRQRLGQCPLSTKLSLPPFFLRIAESEVLDNVVKVLSHDLTSPLGIVTSDGIEQDPMAGQGMVTADMRNRLPT